MTQTSAPPTAGSPISGWLLPGTQDARLRLEKVTADKASHIDQPAADKIRLLGAVGRKALAQELEAKLRDGLGDTVFDVIVGGWRTYGAIEEAVAKSRQEPGVDQVVSLTRHEVAADREKDFDVAVDGIHLMTLTARLDMAIQLYDAVAVVRDGALIAIRSGHAQASAKLTVEGVRVAEQTSTFPLEAELTLHRDPHLAG
jgi:hypothetical protein